MDIAPATTGLVLDRYGCPGIFNTDQGSQFTSAEFTDILHKCGIRIGMDGKGAWRDNVFVERLWRSVKYEKVCLKAYDSVRAARGPVLLPRVPQRAPTPFFPGSEDAR